MYRAVDVAYKMLQLADEQGKSLSNLQLQKLLYIAHGYLLAWKNKPLFMDEVSAWKYGPVIHSVYNQFKEYGAAKIPVGPVESGVENDDVIQTLEGTLKLYGDWEAMDLVSITHQPKTPWHEVWEIGGGNQQLFSEIPENLIKDHYRRVISDPKAVQGL